MKFTVEIELVDLTNEQRAELAEQEGLPDDEMGFAEDIAPHDLADALQYQIELSQDEYLWAGSDMYARIASVKVTPA
jgi:hypothetical protein